MEKLRINKIYPSFMGECNVHGIGTPCTFVRLAGCNLRCYSDRGFCDTPEALDIRGGKLYDIADVVCEVTALKRQVICITGGEPLLQKEPVRGLIRDLAFNGFYVVVETNGSISISDFRANDKVTFVVDYKSKSSGVNKQMFMGNYHQMQYGDFIKFVLDDEEDLEEFECFYKDNILHSDYPTPNVAVGLFWGSKITYGTLFSVLREKYPKVYVNMQTHKMACLYDIYKDTETFSKIFVPKNL